MVIDLHAKNQLIICKRLEKSLENCVIAENLVSARPVVSPKIDGA